MNNKCIATALAFILDATDSMSTIVKIEKAKQLIPHQFIRTYHTNDVLINMNSAAKYVYIFLDGKATVRGSLNRNDGVISNIEPIEILGLFELVTNEPHYTAFVMAEEKSLVFRIPSSLFREIVQENGKICYCVLSIFAKTAGRTMQEAATKRLLESVDIIGYYLYTQANKHRPYICPYTREDLAKILNINLRTLYRYLESMKKENLITSIRGKLVITDQHFALLHKRYSSMTI